MLRGVDHAAQQAPGRAAPCCAVYDRPRRTHRGCPGAHRPSRRIMPRSMHPATRHRAARRTTGHDGRTVGALARTGRHGGSCRAACTRPRGTVLRGVRPATSGAPWVPWRAPAVTADHAAQQAPGHAAPCCAVYDRPRRTHCGCPGTHRPSWRIMPRSRRPATRHRAARCTTGHDGRTVGALARTGRHGGSCRAACTRPRGTVRGVRPATTDAPWVPWRAPAVTAVAHPIQDGLRRRRARHGRFCDASPAWSVTAHPGGGMRLVVRACWHDYPHPRGATARNAHPGRRMSGASSACCTSQSRPCPACRPPGSTSSARARSVVRCAAAARACPPLRPAA
jgi:hypothetical protein